MGVNSRRKGSTIIWKTIKGFEDYQVSSNGDIKSFKYTKEGKLMIPRPGGFIKLTSGGIGSRFKISRLVYQAFHGPLIKGLVIDHIDNNPMNNYYGNLQQITPRLNTSKDRKNTSSQYTGVTLHKSRKSRGLSYWAAAIRIGGKRRHIGYFDNEKEASKAYNQKLKMIDG